MVSAQTDGDRLVVLGKDGANLSQLLCARRNRERTGSLVRCSSDDVTDQWRFRPSGYRMRHFGGPSVARIAIGIILEPKSQCAINRTSGLIPAACSMGSRSSYPCRNYPAGDERKQTEQLEHLRPFMEKFIDRNLYGCRAGGLR